MKGLQNKKGFDLQKPIPGCMGRMVNLFDFANTGTKLLTEKPHRDGISFTIIFFSSNNSKIRKEKDASDFITLSGFSPRRSFSEDVSIPIDQLVVHRGEKQVRIQKVTLVSFIVCQEKKLEHYFSYLKAKCILKNIPEKRRAGWNTDQNAYRRGNVAGRNRDKSKPAKCHRQTDGP
jgi:hypothetical protein